MKLQTSTKKISDVCSSDGQSKSKKEQFYDGCSKKEPFKQDRNCQADKSDMQPVKPPIDMQSNRPAVPIQNKMSKKQRIPQDDDKNCQVNNEALCSDKKCQATKCYQKVGKNCQTSNMWPVKPKNGYVVNAKTSKNTIYLQEKGSNEIYMFWQELPRNSQFTNEAKEAYKSYVVSDHDKWHAVTPNQQLQDCVVTRTVNLQDVTRNLILFSMARAVNLPIICVMTRKSESEGTYFLFVVSTKILIVNRLGHSLK